MSALAEAQVWHKPTSGTLTLPLSDRGLVLAIQLAFLSLSERAPTEGALQDGLASLHMQGLSVTWPRVRGAGLL